MVKLSCIQTLEIDQFISKFGGNTRKNNIDKLKKNLYIAIEIYGRDSPVVLEISRKLDKYIVKKIKRGITYKTGNDYILDIFENDGDK